MECPEFKEAEKTALKLIARAEQTVAGLTRKLEKRGYDSACAGAVVSRLLELNLVNDRRYAQMWLNTRLRLPRSPRRLLSALCARGIDRDDAEAALKAVLDEETEAKLLSLYMKKYGKKVKNGSLKYLLKTEGFSSFVIENYLNADL